jgi:4-hydroxyphenylpyruvate dioxygenase-like putative hemolysin
MRIDHIAYRVKDRNATAKFFQEALGYKYQTEFTIDFGDGDTAQCIALEPPEKTDIKIPWVNPLISPRTDLEGSVKGSVDQVDYHLPAEIFISDGTPNSVVGKWVAARNGIGGIHHVAYQVESVEATMKEWKEKGYAEFTSDEPMRCPGLTQVFTKPSELTGVIFEFIERGEFGFCQSNVRALMDSTKDL